MENASKALIIAGSVLIAVLVISLVVAFYGNIREIMATNNKADVEQEIAEYNKQYDAYDRDDVSGVDLLSLINKVYDYNVMQVDTDGYEELEVRVTFTKDVLNGIAKGTYSERRKTKAGDISLKDRIDEIKNEMETIGNKKYRRKENI